MSPSRRFTTVGCLGISQTLAWASSYYLPAMLAVPMARDLGVSVSLVYAAFSTALIASALLGPFAGRLIDRYGGRPVLIATNLVFAAGLGGLATVHGPVSLFAAWLLIGLGMGAGLYEAAFSTLVRLFGHEARGTITGITLIAGFASTVGWPLSAGLEHANGWRGACLAWAGLHLLLGVPLNALLPRAVAPFQTTGPIPEDATNPGLQPVAGQRVAVMLSAVFAITWFISTAMAAHLPRLLAASGMSLAAAVTLAALVGPAQVGARLLEFGFLRRLHPLLSAQLAAVAHPLGAVCLMIAGAPAGVVFTLLHGAGNGILTIAKGNLPLVIFGPVGYGARQGLLMVPARIAQAFSPFLFGLCIDRWGIAALRVSTVLGLAAFVLLLALPAALRRRDAGRPTGALSTS